MLGEGFLIVLPYREEKQLTSTSKQTEQQSDPRCADPFSCTLWGSGSAGLQVHSAETGPSHKEPDSPRALELKAVPPGSVGVLIPGCSPDAGLHPVCIEDCSLLEQYPDLQVADSGRISHNPPRTAVSQHDCYIQPPDRAAPEQEPQGEPLSSIPDQGYLVMGASVNVSLDLPGSGMEPMSNSVLNGLLEKQLEQVYMQHLTEHLARCDSHQGNSLLHGLVPPPPPPSQGPQSLEPSMEENSETSSSKISYLSTHNLAPCSSNFSSPVLRISESDSPHLQ